MPWLLDVFPSSKHERLYMSSNKAKNVQIWAIHSILVVEISNFVINFLNFFLLLVALKSHLGDQISASVATARLLYVSSFLVM